MNNDFKFSSSRKGILVVMVLAMFINSITLYKNFQNRDEFGVVLITISIIVLCFGFYNWLVSLIEIEKCDARLELLNEMMSDEVRRLELEALRNKIEDSR